MRTRLLSSSFLPFFSPSSSFHWFRPLLSSFLSSVHYFLSLNLNTTRSKQSPSRQAGSSAENSGKLSNFLHFFCWLILTSLNQTPSSSLKDPLQLLVFNSFSSFDFHLQPSILAARHVAPALSLLSPFPSPLLHSFNSLLFNLFSVSSSHILLLLNLRSSTSHVHKTCHLF